MKRKIVNIDEELCTGCGDCVPNCHEGALQIIDGKARLISDLMCDGLGACLGHCPENAITIEEREAEPYDEVKVIAEMATKGKNTVVAHLKHLKEHGEHDFLRQAVRYLMENSETLPFDPEVVIREVHGHGHAQAHGHGHHGGGCPGSRTMTFEAPVAEDQEGPKQKSALRQWPVQMHLVSPMAPYFRNADLLLAADCVAFSLGDFHQTWLKGKALAIACPKLDSEQETYLEKLVQMIDEAQINTITVMIMQVPCCGGLLRMAQMAVQQAKRKVPLKSIVVSLQGEILSEQWM